jgi:hypothetical protein
MVFRSAMCDNNPVLEFLEVVDSYGECELGSGSSMPIISSVGYFICGVICFFTDTPDDFEGAQPPTKGERAADEEHTEQPTSKFDGPPTTEA